MLRYLILTIAFYSSIAFPSENNSVAHSGKQKITAQAVRKLFATNHQRKLIYSNGELCKIDSSLSDSLYTCKDVIKSINPEWNFYKRTCNDNIVELTQRADFLQLERSSIYESMKLLEAADPFLCSQSENFYLKIDPNEFECFLDTNKCRKPIEYSKYPKPNKFIEGDLSQCYMSIFEKIKKEDFSTIGATAKKCLNHFESINENKYQSLIKMRKDKLAEFSKKYSSHMLDKNDTLSLSQIASYEKELLFLDIMILEIQVRYDSAKELEYLYAYFRGDNWEIKGDEGQNF